jgi:predicted MFS family arabinose efflux permease
MFAIYTYATTTLLQVTQVSPDLIPVFLVIFGLGLTVGTMFMGYAGDRWPDKAPVVIVALSIFLYAGFAFVMSSMTGMAAYLFLVGCMGSLGSLIQTRLMDVAGKAQTMAAAMKRGLCRGRAVGAGAGADGDHHQDDPRQPALNLCQSTAIKRPPRGPFSVSRAAASVPEARRGNPDSAG